VLPIDLISRVYRTHQLVYRCAKEKKNNKVKMYAQLVINIKLKYLKMYKNIKIIIIIIIIMYINCTYKNYA